MINNCSFKDKEIILRLGTLLNKKFSDIENIDNLINERKIIGYYEDDILIGMIIFNQLYEILDILYVIVDPIYRNKGIATKLVDYLINNKKFDKVMLEVRTDNVNAIKLYKKFDFKIINIRKQYYGNIDAYVMEMIK